MSAHRSTFMYSKVTQTDRLLYTHLFRESAWCESRYILACRDDQQQPPGGVIMISIPCFVDVVIHFIQVSPGYHVTHPRALRWGKPRNLVPRTLLHLSAHFWWDLGLCRRREVRVKVIEAVFQMWYIRYDRLCCNKGMARYLLCSISCPAYSGG